MLRHAAWRTCTGSCSRQRSCARRGSVQRCCGQRLGSRLAKLDVVPTSTSADLFVSVLSAWRVCEVAVMDNYTSCTLSNVGAGLASRSKGVVAPVGALWHDS